MACPSRRWTPCSAAMSWRDHDPDTWSRRDPYPRCCGVIAADSGNRSTGVRVTDAVVGVPPPTTDEIGLQRRSSARTQPRSEPDAAPRDQCPRRLSGGQKESRAMKPSARSVPAETLLRRLGWHHRKVICRDGNGQRIALHLRRRTHEIVEIDLPDGCLVRLTNVEAGRLRAALREVLIAEHQPHRAEDSMTHRIGPGGLAFATGPGLHVRHRPRPGGSI